MGVGMSEAEHPLADLVTGYIDRVVNRRDITAVDDLVSPDYRGHGWGWPAERDALRDFYLAQYRERPNWQIEVQRTVELATSVVVRATTSGHSGPDMRLRRVE
jgi:predicted SnoaL-like aldol condensation-catalyzing enzyme